MHSGHDHSLQEREFFHRECLIKVLALDVKTNVFVGNGHSVLSGVKVHPGGVVVFIIDDVHLVVAIVLQLVLLLHHPIALQHHYLILSLEEDLVLELILFLEIGVEPPPADNFLQEEILLVVVKVRTLVILVLGGLPLPAITNFDEVVTRPLELIWGELSSFLEHVLLGWRSQLGVDILCPIYQTHQEQVIQIRQLNSNIQVIIILLILSILFKIEKE